MSELPNLSLFPPGHERVRVAAEKSNFSQTCNLLVSQKYYLIKEEKSFNDHLNLGITSSTTSIVLEEEEEEEDMKEKSESIKVKSMDLFPQNSGFGPRSTSVSVPKQDDDDNMIISSKKQQQQQQQQQADDDFSEIRSVVKLEPESSTAPPMTIFYGGKVLVFNNISVTKAKQIFNFAATNNNTNNNNTNAISSSSHSATPIPPPPPPNTTGNNNNNNNLNNSGTLIPSVLSSAASNLAPASKTTTTTAAAAAAGMMMMMINSKQQNFKAPKLSDLPIQRKASLHRFLEKRKDRINARTPYNNQVNSSKSTESVADKVMQKEDKEESKFCLISSAN